jgi:phage anti-repressor protein
MGRGGLLVCRSQHSGRTPTYSGLFYLEDILTSELIKVERIEGIESVNARELHGFLDVGRDYSSWIKQRIEKYGFSTGSDYEIEHRSPLPGTGNRGASTEYHISIDMAKELSMVENNEKGREARQYFIAREKQAKELEKIGSTQAIDYMALSTAIATAVSSSIAPIIAALTATRSEPQIEAPVTHATLAGYSNINKLDLTQSEKRTAGIVLRGICNQRHLEIRPVPDARYGRVNSYPVHLLDEYFIP